MSTAVRFGCVLVALCALSLCNAGSPAAHVAAQQPAAPNSAPEAKNLLGELQNLQEQVAKLDPKAPDYPVRLKAALQELIRLNQALALENQHLRDQLRAAAATAAPGAGSTARPPSRNPQPAGAITYFGNRGSKKYHRIGCQFGDRTRVTARVPFATPAAAAAAGYQACKVCHPDAPAAPSGAKPQ